MSENKFKIYLLEEGTWRPIEDNYKFTKPTLFRVRALVSLLIIASAPTVTSAATYVGSFSTTWKADYFQGQPTTAEVRLHVEEDLISFESIEVAFDTEMLGTGGPDGGDIVGTSITLDVYSQLYGASVNFEPTPPNILAGSLVFFQNQLWNGLHRDGGIPDWRLEYVRSGKLSSEVDITLETLPNGNLLADFQLTPGSPFNERTGHWRLGVIQSGIRNGGKVYLGFPHSPLLLRLVPEPSTLTLAGLVLLVGSQGLLRSLARESY